MIYKALRYNKSAWTRRLLAALFIVTFPLTILISIILGITAHIVAGAKELRDDFKDFITNDAPEAFRDLVTVLRTGKSV